MVETEVPLPDFSSITAFQRQFSIYASFSGSMIARIENQKVLFTAIYQGIRYPTLEYSSTRYSGIRYSVKK